MENFKHIPVMLKEVIDNFNIKKYGIYVDCTFGNGGHSRFILEKLAKKGKLISFDLDSDIDIFSFDNSYYYNLPNFRFINDNFIFLEKYLIEYENKIDGFLFDLGISSQQIFDKENSRGFSYRSDSILDMRINKNKKIDARTIINNYSYEKLSEIFYLYGEERKSRLIAKKICYWRKIKKIETTQQLVGIIASCFKEKKNVHPARKIFQSLRIFVNDELENLSKALESSSKLISKGGRIIVISYHSIEDRIVKLKFKDLSAKHYFKIITKKPISASIEELSNNNRSRSAKMRIIEKL